MALEGLKCSGFKWSWICMAFLRLNYGIFIHICCSFFFLFVIFPYCPPLWSQLSLVGCLPSLSPLYFLRTCIPLQLLVPLPFRSPPLLSHSPFLYTHVHKLTCTRTHAHFVSTNERKHLALSLWAWLTLSDTMVSGSSHSLANIMTSFLVDV